MKTLVLLVALLVAMPATAQDLMVRVRALHVTETDFCSNCTATNIHPSYWTIYEAQVRHVIKGHLDEKTVHFAFAQGEQYTPKALKHLVVFLRPASPWLRDQFHVDYEASEIGFH
jgi:hypothetical protein